MGRREKSSTPHLLSLEHVYLLIGHDILQCQHEQLEMEVRLNVIVNLNTINDRITCHLLLRVAEPKHIRPERHKTRKLPRPLQGRETVRLG